MRFDVESGFRRPPRLPTSIDGAGRGSPRRGFKRTERRALNLLKRVGGVGHDFGVDTRIDGSQRGCCEVESPV